MFSIGEKILWNFYIADRNKTSYEHVHEVPEMTQQMIPLFVGFIVAESIILYLTTGKATRINDGVSSLSHGVIMEIVKLFTRGFELWGYEQLYEYRILDLDWRSPWTWWGAAIGVDFCYYWVHRAVHEISFFWGSHSVHHSAEDYNLTTALRQSAFQHFFTIGFYQPLALMGIPLPTLLVHMNFNLFYQFWIHTELVSNLGPLEWIFNTASHHRVHHGSNKWCLDKNYGGFLIIWDRMFGTFEPERKDEEIVYGLVSQPQTFNPFYHQLFYFKNVIVKSASMNTWNDKLKAIFYGPGWNPGTARLGDDSDIPMKPVRKKYDPQISRFIQYYTILHFFFVILSYQHITENYMTFHWTTAFGFIFFMLFSVLTIGGTFDKTWWAPILESCRCSLTFIYLASHELFKWPLLNQMIRFYFGFSAVLWAVFRSNLLVKKFKTQ